MTDDEDLDALSDDELMEMLDAYERVYLEEQRTDIVAFAMNTEVPGTPAPYSDSDRIALLKRKEELRMERDENGDREDIEDVGVDEVDGEEDDFYPQRLRIAEHQQMILEVMQALIEEEPIRGPLANGHRDTYADGVILMFPPGAAKSTYASVVAPAWVLGRYSNTNVMCLSYGARLSKGFGRRVRHIVRQPQYVSQFGVNIRQDNQAVDQWGLDNGSTYMSTGILGGVTGNRADLAIVDDPIAGREEAESEIIREKTWEAFKDDVLTRLKPRGKVCMILTRWHEDDPAGRVLGEDWNGESGLWKGTDDRMWLILRVPLLADRDDDPLGRAAGDRLWPDWFSEKHVRLQRAAGDRSWNSLQQQNPSASDGNILLKSLWRCWPHGKPEPTPEQKEDPSKTLPPKQGVWKQCVLVYDTAIEEDEQNDYTAMTAWLSFETNTRLPHRRDESKKMQNLLLIGAWRGRIQAADLKKTVLEHINHFEPDRVVIEKRASGHQLVQELKRLRPRHRYGEVSIHDWLPPGPPRSTGKVSRASGAALTFSERAIWYMPGPLTEAVIKECAAFPNGRSDDWVDTVTCMVLFARDTNLLEIAPDALSALEETEAEARKSDAMNNPRGAYGHTRSRPYTQASRSLYGRSSRADRIDA